MKGSDGAIFASFCVVVYSSGPTFLVKFLLALTGNRAQDLGILYLFPGFYPVVVCPLVVALCMCQWSRVVRLGVVSRLLSAGVVSVVLSYDDWSNLMMVLKCDALENISFEE